MSVGQAQPKKTTTRASVPPLGGDETVKEAGGFWPVLFRSPGSLRSPDNGGGTTESEQNGENGGW